MKKKRKTSSNINTYSLDQFIAIYLYEVKRSLEALDPKKIAFAIDLLFTAYQKNKKVFIIGNGGSASTASHMACDLAKGTLQEESNNKEKRFKVISLTDNMALITALANDSSFEDIFVQQLRSLMEEDDVVIALSASGNSKNILKAVEYAQKNGGKTIGMIGFKNGGKLRAIVDCEITIDSIQYGPIEDIHLILNHLIASWIAKIKNGYGVKDKFINKNKAVPFA